MPEKLDEVAVAADRSSKSFEFPPEAEYRELFLLLDVDVAGMSVSAVGRVDVVREDLMPRPGGSVVLINVYVESQYQRAALLADVRKDALELREVTQAFEELLLFDDHE